MKNSLLSGIILISLIMILGSSTFVNDDCDELRKENVKLKTELEIAKKQADAANLEAQKQATLAFQMKTEAEKQRGLAEEARKRAEAAAIEARRQEQLARQQTEQAQQGYERAQRLLKSVQDSVNNAKKKN